MLHGLKRSWSSGPRNSSCILTFSGLTPDAVRFEEVLHSGGNFDDVCLYRKMSGVEELNLRAGYVLPESFRSCRNEERIVLTPDRKQRWLRFTEIFLKCGIKLYVRRVIQE